MFADFTLSGSVGSKAPLPGYTPQEPGVKVFCWRGVLTSTPCGEILGGFLYIVTCLAGLQLRLRYFFRMLYLSIYPRGCGACVAM